MSAFCVTCELRLHLHLCLCLHLSSHVNQALGLKLLSKTSLCAKIYLNFKAKKALMLVLPNDHLFFIFLCLKFMILWGGGGGGKENKNQAVL